MTDTVVTCTDMAYETLGDVVGEMIEVPALDAGFWLMGLKHCIDVEAGVVDDSVTQNGAQKTVRILIAHKNPRLYDAESLKKDIRLARDLVAARVIASRLSEFDDIS